MLSKDCRRGVRSGRSGKPRGAGLTGSGKTTFARTLESAGVVRLSVDEEVFNRHGRYGVDYPDHPPWDGSSGGSGSLPSPRSFRAAS